MKKTPLIIAALMLATAPVVYPAQAMAQEKVEYTPEQVDELEFQVEQGNVDAALALGVFFETVEEDPRRAAKFYEIAANAGNLDAMTRLGTLYRWGNGVPTNGKKAEAWFLKAASQNYGPALSALGEIYKDGYILPLDEAKSVQYYTMAAEHGDPIGQYFMGMKYMNGDTYSPQDYRKAAEWLLKSAGGGYAPAQANLGILFQYGYGVAQDGKKAFELFVAAADQGDMLGQYYAGMTLLSQQDHNYFPQGFDYINQAAEQGYVAAMQLMPQLYSEGKGVKQSAPNAYKWHMILYLLTPSTDKQALGRIKVLMHHLGDYMSNKDRHEAKNAAEDWVRRYREKHGYR